jgi:hypothetical protein
MSPAGGPGQGRLKAIIIDSLKDFLSTPSQTGSPWVATPDFANTPNEPFDLGLFQPAPGLAIGLKILGGIAVVIEIDVGSDRLDCRPQRFAQQRNGLEYA